MKDMWDEGHTHTYCQCMHSIDHRCFCNQLTDGSDIIMCIPEWAKWLENRCSEVLSGCTLEMEMALLLFLMTKKTISCLLIIQWISRFSISMRLKYYIHFPFLSSNFQPVFVVSTIPISYRRMNDGNKREDHLLMSQYRTCLLQSITYR